MNNIPWSPILAISQENYKTHDFDINRICIVCGLNYADFDPVEGSWIMIKNDFSCVEWQIKLIIE